MGTEAAIVAVEAVGLRIRIVRDTKVMLDADLAELYGVEDAHADSGGASQPRSLP